MPGSCLSPLIQGKVPTVLGETQGKVPTVLGETHGKVPTVLGETQGKVLTVLGETQEMFWIFCRRGKINTLPLPGTEPFAFQPIAYGL
jgi:hypothetical protein